MKRKEVRMGNLFSFFTNKKKIQLVDNTPIQKREYPLIFLLSESYVTAEDTAAKNFKTGYRAKVENNLPTVVSRQGSIQRPWHDEEYVAAWDALMKYQVNITKNQDVMDSLNYEYPLDRDPRFLTGGFHPSFGDPTWKERHAKGVPVKIEIKEWIKSSFRLPNMPEHHHVWVSWTIGNDWGTPVIGVYRNQFREAVFCNFRYKPEWLERPDKHCAKGNCIGDGSCYHCGCAYTRYKNL